MRYSFKSRRRQPCGDILLISVMAGDAKKARRPIVVTETEADFSASAWSIT
jgi:hypothetical protein